MSNDTTEPKIFITTCLRPGMSITCEAGHPIATAKTDTRLGDEGWVDHVEWIQPKPDEGGACRCHVCGGSWSFVHTKPAVRPPLEIRQRFVCIDRKWTAPLPDGAREWLDSVSGKSS